jgi:sterol desaturase/sphingolipid hydroxylase (fatty acid hydroxylase superfamily)
MNELAEYLRYALYLFLFAAVSDALVAWVLRRRRARDPKEAASNLVIYMMAKGWRDYVTRGIEVSILAVVYAAAPYKLPITWWAFGLTLLASDFVYYWKHRAEHRVRFMWAYHSVHHSSEEFNLTTAFRLPWLGGFTVMMVYLPLVLAGCNPFVLLLCRQIVLLYQFWIHTGSIGSLGLFDQLFNSPANHRVHHGTNPLYLDRNHGGILIIWDRLFGSYQRELPEEPVKYGLTKKIATQNPLRITLHEPLAVLRDIRGARSLWDALGYVFREPGWKPRKEASLLHP